MRHFPISADGALRAGQRDGRAWQHGAGRVSDRAGDGADALGETQRATPQAETTSDKNEQTQRHGSHSFRPPP